MVYLYYNIMAWMKSPERKGGKGMKRWQKVTVAILTATLSFTACGLYKNESSAEIYAMNTFVSITLWGKDGTEVLLDSENFIYNIEEQISTTRTSSEIYQMNHNSGQWYALSPEVLDVLEYALDMAERTEGAFNPTVYPLVSAWGFTQSEYQVPTEEALAELLPLVDIAHVSVDREEGQVMLAEGVAVDFGGIAKGYVADYLADFYRDEGYESAMISLGGNIYALGLKQDGSLWNIGIQNPYGAGAVGSVAVEDKAVVTSGGYQRYFIEDDEVYWHIIDPRTGYPAKTELASVSVVSDSAMYGDSLSTALFVMGLEEAQEFWRTHGDFDAVFITTEGDIFITQGLEKIFTPVKEYTGQLQVVYE